MGIRWGPAAPKGLKIRLFVPNKSMRGRVKLDDFFRVLSRRRRVKRICVGDAQLTTAEFVRHDSRAHL